MVTPCIKQVLLRICNPKTQTNQEPVVRHLQVQQYLGHGRCGRTSGVWFLCIPITMSSLTDMRRKNKIDSWVMCIYTLYITQVKQRSVQNQESHRENPLVFSLFWRQLFQTHVQVRTCGRKGKSPWARAEASLDFQSESLDGNNQGKAVPHSCLCVHVIVCTWMCVIILSVSVCNGALTQTHISLSALWVGFFIFLKKIKPYFFTSHSWRWSSLQMQNPFLGIILSASFKYPLS